MAIYLALHGDKAGFAQYQGAFGGHDLVLGIRHDDNEQSGGNITGNVACLNASR
jgi:vitamin B12 transporter